MSSSLASLIDRRSSVRIPRRLRAWLEGPDGEVFECATADLSDGGVCLTGFGIPCQIGDNVRVCIERHSAMHEGWVDGQVRWRSPDRVGISAPELPGARLARR